MIRHKSSPESKGKDFFDASGVSKGQDALLQTVGRMAESQARGERSEIDGTVDGADWPLQEGMVIAAHLLCPGNEKERCWIEEVFLVKEGGAEAFFTWGNDPLTNG